MADPAYIAMMLVNYLVNLPLLLIDEFSSLDFWRQKCRLLFELSVAFATIDNLLGTFTETHGHILPFLGLVSFQTFQSFLKVQTIRYCY